ncbi:MAG: ribosome biogenesis GTPase Der [Caldilineaceae bacterium]|nr:ribosome biogenesis GTPase Der [Caldilineaceae bacterium]
MNKRKPVVALVGRPNVGKSTLFNRLTGTRTAIVEDIPGTTRDRIYGHSDWNGVGFIVVDTGGLEAPTAVTDRSTMRERDLPLGMDSALFVSHIQNQATVAMEEADAVIFVVDGKEGLTAADEDVADVLRHAERPVFLAVNKTESPQRKLDAVEFWNLGLGEPYPISAYHGDGTGDLLDELVKVLPAYPPEDVASDAVGIAIVGRPNVGKSSLLNALIGMDRAIVSDVPGTTRDPIDTEIIYDGQTIRLIDTAGIRRRGRVEPGIEKYSVLRSMRSIDRADVALLLIDATEGVTAQDAHVAGFVLDRNKSVVVIVNKWDAVEKDTHTMVEFTRQIRTDLRFLDYVPVLFISAQTRQRVNKVLPAALDVAEARHHRLTTSEVNHIIHEAYDRNAPPTRQGRALRLYYGTQIETEPPTFIIFVNDDKLVHFSYGRYMENQIRAYYPFIGTPIRVIFRSREKRK